MYGVVELATVQLTDPMQGGAPITIRAIDFRRASKFQGGSLVLMSDGQSIFVTESPAEIHTAINDLWDALLLELPA